MNNISKIKKIDLISIYLWPLRVLAPLLVVLMLVLSVLIFKGFVIGQTQTLKTLQNNEIELKANLINKYSRLKQVPVYVAKSLELDQLESEVNERFPSSDELSLLLVQVNQIAEDSNISINNFTPKETKEVRLNNPSSSKNMTPGNISTMGKADKVSTSKLLIGKKITVETFSIALHAKYLNFVDFVFRLAKLSRVISIQNIHITRVGNGDINANLDIKIFFSSK